MKSASATPSKGLPSAISALAPDTRFKVVRMPAASIVRNGNQFTTNIKTSAAIENEVTRANEAGRF